MTPIQYENKNKQKIIFSDAGSEWEGELSDKPEIEQQLFYKQAEYYKAKTLEHKQQVWSDMFILVQRYSKSLVLKKNTGKKYKEPEQVEDEATQTALSFMSQYVYRPGYHVGASFAGMINPKVLETLFKKNKDDQAASLNSSFRDSNLELEDMQETAGFEELYDTKYDQPGSFIDDISLNDTLTLIIKEFNAEVKDEATRLKVLFYLYILLRKPKNKHILPMFLKYITPDKVEYDLVQLFQLELRNRLMNN